jgi:hypothetical protein
LSMQLWFLRARRGGLFFRYRVVRFAMVRLPRPRLVHEQVGSRPVTPLYPAVLMPERCGACGSASKQVWPPRDLVCIEPARCASGSCVTGPDFARSIWGLIWDQHEW